MTPQETRTRNKWAAGPLVLGLAMGLSNIGLHAQPGVAPPPAPPGAPPAGPGAGGPGGDLPNFRDMNPEQRQQWMEQRRVQMQQARAEGIRRMLTDAGFTQTGLQDAVVDFARVQEEATQPLREQAQRVQQALRNGGMTDAQLATLLSDFRAEVAQERTRRAAALKALDQEIGYSKQPRLDALLTMGGLIGDEASIAGVMGGRGGPGGPGGGRGGFGGPGGGGFGGPGGGGGGRGGRRGGGGGGGGGAGGGEL
ncbi:MAG TPA: hypothetical protein VF600_07360 [Abditibacteriaceae bacterium]